jgi:hypothetical protein
LQDEGIVGPNPGGGRKRQVLVHQTEDMVEEASLSQ